MHIFGEMLLSLFNAPPVSKGTRTARAAPTWMETVRAMDGVQ